MTPEKRIEAAWDAVAPAGYGKNYHDTVHKEVIIRRKKDLYFPACVYAFQGAGDASTAQKTTLFQVDVRSDDAEQARDLLGELRSKLAHVAWEPLPAAVLELEVKAGKTFIPVRAALVEL